MFSGCRRWLLTIVLVVVSRVPRLLGCVRLIDLERHFLELLVVGALLGRRRAGLLGRVLAGRFHVELTHCETSRVTVVRCPVPSSQSVGEAAGGPGTGLGLRKRYRTSKTGQRSMYQQGHVGGRQ